MTVCDGRLLKKSSNRKSKLVLSKIEASPAAGVRRSLNNHDCSRIASQVTPQGRHQHANASGGKVGPVTTWLQLSNIAFHFRPIWLQTLVEIDSESCQTLLPSFCAPPSEVSVLFDSNLSRRRLVDFHCTGFNSEHAVLFLFLIFTQRQMNDRKIERSDGRGFGRQ